MRRRCNTSTHISYPNYGGRGIRVCTRWNDFTLFVEDMGDRPAGYTLERIDNDADYSPDNCIWADWETQCANRRPRKSGVWSTDLSDPMRYITMTPEGTYLLEMTIRKGKRVRKRFESLDDALDYRSDTEMEREMFHLLS